MTMGTETSARKLNLGAFSDLLKYCRHAEGCWQYSPSLHGRCVCSLTDCLTDYKNQSYDDNASRMNKAEEVIDDESQSK